eukprot:scaffold39273_cov53-Attheya_sp.AAC.3
MDLPRATGPTPHEEEAVHALLCDLRRAIAGPTPHEEDAVHALLCDIPRAIGPTPHEEEAVHALLRRQPETSSPGSNSTGHPPSHTSQVQPILPNAYIPISHTSSVVNSLGPLDVCERKRNKTWIRIVTTLLPTYIGERCSPIKRGLVNQAVDDMLSLGGRFVKPKNGKFKVLDSPHERFLMARTYFSNYRLYSYLVSYLESIKPMDSVPVDSNESCQE